MGEVLGTQPSACMFSHITQDINHWAHSTEKGKTIWFFNENPSHPPVFNNNNNLCYEQLPYKIITSEDLCAMSGKSYLSMNVVLRGQKLKTKSTLQKQEA